jgi:hypothetical protein
MKKIAIINARASASGDEAVAPPAEILGGSTEEQQAVVYALLDGAGAKPACRESSK